MTEKEARLLKRAAELLTIWVDEYDKPVRTGLLRSWSSALIDELEDAAKKPTTPLPPCNGGAA